MSAANGFFGAIGSFFNDFLLAPAYLGFLGLIPLVILLYLLKLRRTRVVVSSTLLWMRSLQDLTANAPFQRLRKNLLLLLQILVLFTLAVGVARPFVRSEGVAGETLCVLIDRSASMQTREEGASRLDLAKGEALELVNDMERGDKMMLVTFAETSDVLCELTADRVRLRRLIEGIEPSDTRTRLHDAMLVAHSLRFTVDTLKVIAITDGNISDLDELGERDYDFSFLQVGRTRGNAGIVAFSVRDPLEGQGERQSFVLVHNASSEPLETTLTLAYNGQTIAVEEVHAAPGDSAELAFSHDALGEGVLRATLDHVDALDVDNSAWLALRPPSTIKVLLVAHPNSTSAYFLKRVLASDARAELSIVPPSQYVLTDAYDITIFDGMAPGEESIPAGTSLFLNAAPASLGVVDEGEIERPAVVATDAEHPMMRYLNPANVGIRRARRFRIPDEARTLVSTVGAPLIADISRGERRVLVVAFDIAESDWPLHLSFPLFFQNLLAWTPRATLESQTSIRAGGAIPVMPDPALDSVDIVRPDGVRETIQLDPLRPVFYARTEGAGVYRMERGDLEEAYAVNLLDMTESAIRPADTIKIALGEVTAQRGRVRQNKELWRHLVGAALAILCVEWWLYSRRAWI